MSRHTCEGKNLESVLEEVRNRFGGTATIVEANRLLKGGVGGFFARERFEVVVDVDDDEDAPAADGVSELPGEFGMEATEDFCERLLSMADEVTDAPTVSTEHPNFAAVLESLTRHMESPATAPVPLKAPATPTAQAMPAPPPAPAAAKTATPSGPATAAPAAPVAAALPAPESSKAPAAPAASNGPAASNAPAAPVAPAAPAVRVPAPEPVPGIDNRALARLGLPEDIRRAALAHPAPPAGTDPAPWLMGLLESLPQPATLPSGQGAVIVVAGARDAALDLARALSDELGLDPESLCFASVTSTGRARFIPGHRRLHDIDAAGEARRSWRRRPRPTVVAVEAPPGRSSDWARRVIDALEPTMVWATVDAGRKPEDLFEWAERLGGFDALSLTDLDDTVSPAAALQCGIPVGRIDGRPASAALWAALLAPRLSA